MPTYVYECERCGHRFELLQGISDPPRQRCPECRGKVRRVLLPGGGLIFKGSGFYITDYKRKPEPPSAEGGSGTGSRGGAGAAEKGRSSDGSGGSSAAGGSSGTGGKTGPSGKAGGKEKGA